VVGAPGSHRVVLENETTRVLEVTIAPGEREPEHTHRWPSVMVVHRPARIRYYTGDTVTFASPEQPSPAAPHGSAGSIPQADIRWRTSTGMSTEPSVSSSSSFNVALVGLVRDRGEIQPVWHRPSRPRRPGGGLVQVGGGAGELVDTLDPDLDQRLDILPVYSPDGRWLAGTYFGGRVVVWDTRSWQKYRVWEADEVFGDSAFTSDSRLLVAGGAGTASIAPS
jgi:hypothetical protein